MIATATANKEDQKNAIQSWTRGEGEGGDNDAHILQYV